MAPNSWARPPPGGAPSGVPPHDSLSPPRVVRGAGCTGGTGMFRGLSGALTGSFSTMPREARPGQRRAGPPKWSRTQGAFSELGPGSPAGRRGSFRAALPSLRRAERRSPCPRGSSPCDTSGTGAERCRPRPHRHGTGGRCGPRPWPKPGRTGRTAHTSHGPHASAHDEDEPPQHCPARWPHGACGGTAQTDRTREPVMLSTTPRMGGIGPTVQTARAHEHPYLLA